MECCISLKMLLYLLKLSRNVTINFSTDYGITSHFKQVVLDFKVKHTLLFPL